ncbi:MAG: TonB-dependent receptor [Pirellulales bacterium]|nr:TonB-dependent receptor [Pirellulales bacterium]
MEETNHRVVLVAGLILGLVLLSGEARGQQPPPAPGGEAAAPAPAEPTAENLDALLSMADKDVSQLSQVRVGHLTGSPSLDVPVSTVARQESTVGHSPAAVFVITNEMIRRSGAKNLPDVLRLAPGVNVARIDSNKWSISIRGFSGRFVNNLLVQIDGRAVYTPLFGGVFWDVQDLVLEDVERIEVIRGPGASVWGANAVNGIINIITKSAKDTQGVYVESGTGTEELGFATIRAGSQAGKDLHYRVYGKWFERGAGFSADNPAYDDWRQGRGGFRADWTPNRDDTLTLQGDCYNGYSGDYSVAPRMTPPYMQLRHDATHVSGENAVFHWRRVLDEESDWTLRLYYDRTERHWVNYGLSEDRDTFDFDFQHRFPIGSNHNFIWGCGYRNTKDFVHASTSYGMTPDHRSDNLFSYFTQDEITLAEDLWYLTLGCKFEHNDYTGFEYQPTVRVLWTPDDRRAIWGAVSRAVRTPTRGEENALATLAPFPPPPDSPFPFPTFPVIHGNTGLLSEELIAYELGYRVQATKRFSWDFAVFLYDYEHLIMSRFGAPVPGPGGTFLLPGQLVNAMAGESYGFEWAANYDVTPRWRLHGSYSFVVLDMAPVLYSEIPERVEGQSPRNQFVLGSSSPLGRNWELDVIGRYVDCLPTEQVGSYFAGDVRLAYRPSKHFEWSVVGRNLFAGTHAEYGNDSYLGSFRTEVQQEVFTQIVLRR